MRFLVELSLYTILDMSNPAPQKRKRAYRHRVKCSECKKEIVAEYQDAHARTKHVGKKVKFSISRAPNQSQLGFTGGDETITNMVKCSRVDTENVGSDLQNDSSTDIVVDSSDTAVDKSEMEAMQVNNGAHCTPATSEFMDVGVTDESEIMDKGNSNKSEIMDMESIDNGADNGTSVREAREIVDNGANSDIVHNTNRDMSISVVIDKSVPEKSPMSAITDNNAPDKSDIVDGAHNSSLDTNLCSSTCQTSSDIDESPQQPILKHYNPKKFGSESFSRDFNPVWYKRYPWLSYDFETKKACCYPCQKYLNAHDFTFDNWKKPERLTKHHKSDNHQTAMAKWIDSRANKKRNTSILSKLQESHKHDVQENREYLKVIIECLMFTAQQNIAQRGHDEQRDDLSNSSDVNRGNFLELIHLRCKDIAWLKDKLYSQLQKHAQWTSPVIQNELLQIIADLIRERITNDVRASGWYGIILDETSDISRTEQVSLCLSFALNGTKKEAFIGFYSTKSTEGEVLYELVKSSITELNLDLKNIVGKAFDGAANMNGVHKGLSTRMKECSPFGIYVHCYGHVLNLALQDTMTQTEPLRNALGTIQALHNFLEASPKRHALFSDTEVQGEDLKLTLKSLSTTRWSCRWEAVKAVYGQMERIVKALLTLSSDKDPKTYSESRALLTAICDWEFIFGLCLLKVILSNTCSLSRYLQGKTVDVISARRNADMTIQTLRQCRNEESFNSVWQIASAMGLKIKKWLTNSQFELREARAPRQTPSRRLQALVGEHGQRQTQLTPESYHRINTYYASIDKVLSELELRFRGNDQEILCALGNICNSETPDKESFSRIAKFYNIDGEILEAEQKMYASFRRVRGLGYMTVSEILETMHENDLFDIFPEFSKVVHILAVIPATSCSAERSFSALRRLKTYLRSTMGQQRVSNIALINIERAYANSVVSNDMDHIIDIFGRRNGRDSSFF